MRYLMSHRLMVSAALAVFAIILALSLKSGEELKYYDEGEYHELALSLVRGDGYRLDGRPTAFRPPGYPLFLALVYEAWPSPLAAKVANGCIAALCVLLIYRLGARFTTGFAWWGPVLVLAYPVLAYTATTLYPQTLGALLLVAVVLALGDLSVSPWRLAAAGAIYGCLVLTIPAALLLIPVFLGYLGWAPRAESKAKLARAFVFCAASACVVAPWIARNYELFGELVPVSTNSGVNLLLGNSPGTSYDSGTNVDLTSYYRSASTSSEVGLDAHFRSEAIAWITAHPGSALALYLEKALNYFNFRNELATRSEAARWQELVMMVTYYPLLLLALSRLALARRRPLSRQEWLLYALYFGNALASAIFFTRIRLRLPFDWLLIVLAGAQLSFLTENFLAARRERSRRLARAKRSPKAGVPVESPEIRVDP